MPSVKHEAPIELIRQWPPLAVELVQAMTGETRDLCGNFVASLGPTDLTEVVPAQFLADSVVVVTDTTTGEPAMVIIVEPQGRDDPTKHFSWPVYLTTVRRATRCQRAYLLVICPDPAEAAKCREIIRIGQPGFDLLPMVIDLRNTPGTGGASPYLTIFAACMGAINMEEENSARYVLTAIRNTGAPDADLNRLTAIILNLASAAARQTLEALMTATEWTTHPFIESFKKEGIEEGRREGLIEAKAENLLKLVDARAIKLTAKQRAQVDTCTDPAQLDKWFDRALTATSAPAIFQD